VEKHGRITRREVAELCQLSSLQARDLLARLAKAGKLVLHGTKRGAFYELPSKIMEESKHDMDRSIIRFKTSKPGRDS